MPTIVTHAAIPVLIGAALGRGVISRRLLAAGAVAAMLPDADVIAFTLGIDYADALGHRGASHSFAFALAIGLLGAMAARLLRAPPGRAALWLALCAASHPLLDALTNGGLGVALAWPLSDARWFAPWRPVAVSPIGADFFSLRGLRVLASEARWILMPTLLASILIAGVGMVRSRRQAVDAP